MNEMSQAWHLRGNWAPLRDEKTHTDLVVEGNIPPSLSGVYLRTGPNPLRGISPHWFLGDGMVHGIRIENGKALWHKNRFIQTPNVTAPDIKPDNPFDLGFGTGNTHVMQHAGKILCLEEAHWPWRIDGDLNTIGAENFAGALTCSMTAHPKVCPKTGELLAFSYFSFEQPFLKYIRIGADGAVKQIEGINLPNMVMMHDFNITENYTIFMDLPLVLDLELLATGVPFSFNKEAGARLGVMPRHGTADNIRWFEIDPCYVFHPVNAFDRDGIITLYVSRQESAFSGGSDEYGNVARLWQWQINLHTGVVTEAEIDNRPGDFGRTDDRLVGQDSRYGYLMALGGEGNSEEPVYGDKLYKYDLPAGTCEEHHLGNDVRGSEPVFAPGGPGEDEGWILNLNHDERTGKSRMLIIDAQNFSAPPVAIIHLPERVPYGAHGNWISD
ncbi:MAG: carotenoid oxygenase family protein [bacterium]